MINVPIKMESEPTINFSSLKEHARRQIIDIIDRAPGPKFLALDPSLSGPLSIIIEMSVLKDHGVSKVMAVGSGELDFDTREVIYIVRPTIEMMKIISKQVSDNIKNKEDHRYSLYMCPRVTTVCENILTSDQVFGNFDYIEPLEIYLIPLEVDLLSMQIEKAYRDLVLERDFTMYYQVARSILHIQHMFGPIPLKRAKGIASAVIYM